MSTCTPESPNIETYWKITFWTEFDNRIDFMIAEEDYAKALGIASGILLGEGYNLSKIKAVDLYRA